MSKKVIIIGNDLLIKNIIKAVHNFENELIENDKPKKEQENQD